VIIKGQGESNYTPHMVGAFPAACCDVQDLGWEEHPQYGWKYKVRLVFFAGHYTDEKEVDGERKRFPMTVSKKFTASLADKANLRAFCRSWKGKDFTPDVLRDGFDFELMVGAPAFIQVTHFEWQGETYAGIDSIMRLPQGQDAPTIPGDYTRLQDREGWEGPAAHPAMSEPEAAPEPETAPSGTTEDDLPF